jgi:polyhydroxybutyrate depolymerase
MCLILTAFVVVVLMLAVPTYAGKGCKNKSGVAGDFRYQTIMSGGVEREYNLYVHPRYKLNRPTPLVFLLHGLGGTHDWTMWYTNMTAFADAYKFILVAPQGIGFNWDISSGSADVTFISDIIDAVSEDYCIHPKRIFATGLSKGGGMSHRLACDLSDRIAAIGPVASGTPWVLWSDVCEPERPVPMIQFNGTADVLIPFEGGPHGLNPALIVPPMAEMFGALLDLYGCSAEAEVVYEKGEVTCFRYEDCEDKVTLEHCIVEGGGHNWPGAVDLYEMNPTANWWAAPHTTQDIDASRAIWEFFAEHAMCDDDCECAED